MNTYTLVRLAGVRYLDFIRNAQKEIIIMFPTTNAFLSQHKLGAVELAKEAMQKRNIRVRILMPEHKSTD